MDSRLRRNENVPIGFVILQKNLPRHKGNPRRREPTARVLP
jgi:hypothetical protein